MQAFVEVLQLVLLVLPKGLPKNVKSNDYCKADHSNVYSFLIKIYRLAISVLSRFTDVTEFMIEITKILYRWRMSQ